MYFIGLMSGTSADAVDAALVDIPSIGTLTLRASHRQSIPDDVRQMLQELACNATVTLDQLGELHVLVGRLFAQAAQTLLIRSGMRTGEVRAIGSHGQTVWHKPTGERPFSLQLGDPSLIAELTGITTVADFRARDIAAGGQGAPLAPAFHAAQFRSDSVDRVILNIGGIANITTIPMDPSRSVIGFDTGPGNTLLDQWIYRHQTKAYDQDGRWALTGQVNKTLLARLLVDDYFAAAPPKSTGRERFNLDWLQRHMDALDEPLPPEDVQATLVALSARSIACALQEHMPSDHELFICGGGAHNKALMTALEMALGGDSIPTTEVLGISPDWVEAAAFAWLAQQTIAEKPGNLPSVTGARHPVVLGGIYKA
jgi:anhydro-N-acetylmuramic acid kinase